jgi:DNA-binding transcriptional ArsR family regulator
MTAQGNDSYVSEAAVLPNVGPSEVFKALGDPVRWSIVCQAADVEELAAAVLLSTLSVSKPTISYHVKILVQAGLLAVRKDGRNYFYTLQRDVLQALTEDVWALVPAPRPVRHGAPGLRRARAGSRRPRERDAVGDEVTVLTW